MSRTAIFPLIGLYNNFPNILDGLHVPTTADLDKSLPYVSNIPVLTDADLHALLLAEIGEMTPVYTRPDVLRSMITVWARAHLPEWVKLWQTTILKYNPIWNKDGKYTETLQRSGSNSGKTDNSGTNGENGSTTYGRSDAHNVTGYDTNSYSPNTQDVASGTDTTKRDSSYSDIGSSSGTYNDQQTLTRTETGNIGVTTTQAMIEEERRTAVFNLYAYIIGAFKERFCILLY